MKTRWTWGLALLAAAGTSLATTYNWTGAAGDGDWNDTGNWDTVPVSGGGHTLAFNANPNGYVSSNDLASPFQLNAMTFGTTITLGGSAVELAGTTPAVNIAPGITVTFNNELKISTANTTFRSTVNAANTSTVIFNGLLSGGQTLRYANNSPASSTPIMTFKFAGSVPNTINGFVLGDSNAGRGKAKIQIAMDDPFGGAGTVLNFNNSGAVTIEGLGAPRTIASHIANLRGDVTFIGTNLTWNGNFTPDGGATRSFVNNLDAGATLTLAAGAGAYLYGCSVTWQGSGLCVIPGEVRDGTIPSGGSTVTKYGFTKAGTGTYRLTGANVYSGQTIVQNGILEFNSVENKGSATASALGKPTVDGTKEVISLGSTTTTGTLRYIGATLLGHSTDRPLNLGGTTGGAVLDASGAGPIKFLGGIAASGLGNKILTLQGTNTGLNTVGGGISNSTGFATSLAKSGAGTWQVTGDNPLSGSITVTDGLLLMNGTANSVSSVSVSGSGRLGGTGTVTAATMALGGAVAPGDSIGTLTLAGAVTMSGSFDVETAANGAADLLWVTSGSLSLSGASLNLQPGYVLTPSYTYVIARYPTDMAESSVFAPENVPNDWQILYNQPGQGGSREIWLTEVPEPGTLGLLALAAAFAARRRMRPAA